MIRAYNENNGMTRQLNLFCQTYFFVKTDYAFICVNKMSNLSLLQQRFFATNFFGQINLVKINYILYCDWKISLQLVITDIDFFERNSLRIVVSRWRN